MTLSVSRIGIVAASVVVPFRVQFGPKQATESQGEGQIMDLEPDGALYRGIRNGNRAWAKRVSLPMTI
jgi:hypothetical protein